MRLEIQRAVKTLAILFTLVLPGKVFANASGPKDGGGGQGVVCRQPDGTETIEMFDLWEFKALSKVTGEGAVFEERKFPDTKSAIEFAASRFATFNIDRLSREEEGNHYYTFGPGALEDRIRVFYGLVEGMLSGKYKKTNQVRFLGEGVSLALTDDSESFVSPGENCRLKQIAVTRKDAVYIDKAAYLKMSPLHQAALLSHEVIYRYLRDSHENRSIYARRIVALLFTESSRGHDKIFSSHSISDPFLPVKKSGQRHLLCMAREDWNSRERYAKRMENTSIFHFENEKIPVFRETEVAFRILPDGRVYFTKIMMLPMLTETYAFFTPGRVNKFSPEGQASMISGLAKLTCSLRKMNGLDSSICDYVGPRPKNNALEMSHWNEFHFRGELIERFQIRSSEGKSDLWIEFPFKTLNGERKQIEREILCTEGASDGTWKGFPSPPEFL
jgi:hypothetical protein